MTAIPASVHPRTIPCRSCGAPMVWLRAKSGKAMPVNADTAQPEDREFDHTRHTSHFATCPQAGQHRRSR